MDVIKLFIAVLLPLLTLSANIIPQFDSGEDTQCFFTRDQSQLLQVSFQTTFRQQPQVVLAQTLVDVVTGVNWYHTEISTISLVGFGYSCQFKSRYWIYVNWIAFTDDNIFSLQGSTNTISSIINIQFPNTLAFLPKVAFFTNGISVTQAPDAYNINYVITVGTITNSGFDINVTPGAGYTIQYLSYSVIYGKAAYLNTGWKQSSSKLPIQLYNPVPKAQVVQVGFLSVVCYDSLGEIRMKYAFAGSGQVQVLTWSSLPLTQYVISYFQYSPCPLYCTSCDTNGYPQCDSCVASTLRLNAPKCLTCPSQYFIQADVVNCQPCASYCNNCQLTFTTCLACQISTLRSQPPNCLTCPSNMYIQSGLDNCQQCQPQCNQCTVTANNCTSCNGLYRTNAPNCNQCTLSNYYIDSSYTDCQQCSPYCNGCVTSSNNCLACWPFTFNQLTSTCNECPTIQFTLSPGICTAHIAIVVCTATYNRDSSCNCLPGFYNESNSLACLKCSDQCQTCITTGINCLSCNDSLHLQIPPMCNECSDGYFRQQSNCLQCSNICSTCVSSSTNCLTCSNPRINPPTCQCPDGYFNDCTQSCSSQCQSCTGSSSNCLVCAGNKLNPPLCECPDGSIQQAAICSICSITSPSARFSDDLNSIYIIFPYLISTKINCVELLTEQSYLLMGVNPLCQVNQNIVTINLGKNASIQVSQPIFIQANSLQFNTCNTSISEIVTPLIQAPQNIQPPNLIFKDLIFNTTACDDLVLDIISLTYSGSRAFYPINWTIVQATNTIHLQPLISRWNTFPLQDSYVIDSSYLSGEQSFQIMIQYSNFLGQSSNTTVSVYIQPISIKLNLWAARHVYIYDTTQIILMPEILNCGTTRFSGKITLQVSISNSSSTLNFNNTLNNQEQYQITFKPYELNYQETYQISATASWNSLSTKVNQQFIVILSEIKFIIEGGDQQIGINQFLYLNAQIFDPNQVLTTYNFSSIRWQCWDILTNSQCENFEYNKLTSTLNTSGLSAYNTLNISIQGQLIDEINTKSSITVVVVEEQINQIQILGNQYQLNLPANLYDEIDIVIQYKNQILYDVDNLTYYAQYIDTQYEKNLIQFKFINTSIIVSNFDTQTMNQNRKYKVMVKSPLSSSPSVATQNIYLNIPPKNCQISIKPRGLQFILKVHSCQSISLPLQYKFIYYSSQLTYSQDNNIGIVSNGIELCDYQISSTFISYIVGSNESIISALIKDTNNGLSKIFINLNGLNRLDPNLFDAMMNDDNTHIPQNIKLIQSYLAINDQSLIEPYLDRIQESYNSLNQSNEFSWQIESLLVPSNSIEILSQLMKIKFQINNLATQLSFIQNQQFEGLYNKDYYIELISLRTQAIDISNYVSFLYEQSQQINNRRVLETVQNTTTLLIEAVSNLTHINNKFAKVNQNIQSISTKQFNISSQKFSTQSINQHFETEIIHQSNQTMSYTNQYFLINPYQNQSDFANSITAPLIIPNLTDGNQVQLKPRNPMSFTFPLIKNTDLSCSSQINGTWNLDVCQLIKEPDLQCLCSKLSPVSIVQALQFVFDEFQQLFLSSILNKINQFPYQNTIFTYLIGIFIVVYFVSGFFLNRIDQLDINKVHPASQHKRTKSNDDEFENNAIVSERISSLKVISVQITQIVQSINPYTSDSLLGQINSSKLTNLSGYLKFLKSSHVLLEIYYRFDGDDPRILRLSIVFLQIFDQVCIFILFGKNLAISIVIALSIVQTVYGITFQLILSKMIKSKTTGIQRLGTIISFLITGLCTYLIIASIALYSSVYQSNIAALSYLASFCIDYCFSNILVELAKYQFILNTCDTDKFYKIYSFMLSKGLQEVVFGRKLDQEKKKVETIQTN